jgi:F-type H+-transporting ATPase subunit gamma
MQSRRDIKRRIRSVENIAQITKAMEVVSMTKMRRSQAFALSARPYALASLHLLENLLSMTAIEKLPRFLRKIEIRTALLVVITADKGLVGGFNESILKKAHEWIAEKNKQNVRYEIIAVGRKAKEHFERRKIPLAKSFVGFGDDTHIEETLPIANLIVSGFEEERWDAVDILYTHFKTTLKQETEMRWLLPTTKESIQHFIEEIIPEYGRFSELKKSSAGMIEAEGHERKYNYTYVFEPSPEKIISILVPNLLRIIIHHVMLESNASEHSARMVTMKSASDNASDLEERLTLEFNRVRQSNITAEISEIIAGAEALQ